MTIVQVSDTHIKANDQLAYNKVDTVKALIKCVNHINNLKPKPDFVMFSGDITDSGSKEEYKIFKNIVTSLEIPFYIIPGNHDNRDNLRESFKEYGWYKDGEFLHFSLENFPLRVIGLDSIVLEKPYGALCEKRLNWLDEKLKEFPSKETLLFVHHPPIEIGIEHIDKLNLSKGSKELKEIFEKNSQVVALACGHVHRTTCSLWGRVLVTTAASSSHQFTLDLKEGAAANFILEPPSVALHHYNNKRVTTHVSFIEKFEGPYPLE
ncbi:phosphodiesterase [Halarcobacter ebronensis]|uniref:Phosphodiesterase n=1 Tax=Halarcobacter ebronensis TaxID=1462615 RepID=A0A4Q1ANL9_9BACT|nr:phosphodiesterase [Halarcobacter ebronensis]QKF82516.1 phosphodiesterase [Halarcobacter ebronensis]RXK07467.1 phosphodiesterase [Halarcobacter ebronensis]